MGQRVAAALQEADEVLAAYRAVVAAPGEIQSLEILAPGDEIVQDGRVDAVPEGLEVEARVEERVVGDVVEVPIDLATATQGL